MLERFLSFIQQHQLIKAQDKILIGASAGVDSTVLAHLMYESNFPFALAHMNFQLRGDAANADESFVADLANRYGVPFLSKSVNTKEFARKRGISTQMAARELRFNWFNEIMQDEGYTKVAIGTHLNDQLETVLLNLSKETGINGLTGISPKRENIIRPLLPFTRKEIEDYSAINTIEHRTDQSNADVSYQRNRIRHLVIPELEKINPALLSSFSQSLDHLKQAASYLNDSLQHELAQALTISGEVQKASKATFKQKHGSLLLHTWLSPLGFSKDTLQTVLKAKTGAMYHSETHTINVHGDELILFAKVETQTQKLAFDIPCSPFQYGKYLITGQVSHYSQIDPDPFKAHLNPNSVQGQLYFKTYEQGDRIQPLGMNGTKKLSDVFSDAKVPKSFRDKIPVLCDETGPIWVVGHVISERVKLVHSIKKIYLITAKSTT